MYIPGPWIVSGDLIKSGDGNVACVLSDNPNPDALLIAGPLGCGKLLPTWWSGPRSWAGGTRLAGIAHAQPLTQQGP